MFSFNSPFRFLTTHKPLFSFCFNSSFLYSNPKPTINHFHALTQTKPTTSFNKSSTKQSFTTPKAYMKDTITTISNILRYSPWDSAQQHLQTLTIKWDSYTINQVLKTHPPMEKSWLFFNWASGLRNFKHDQFTYTTMMDIFGEARRISSMKFVFQQMQDKGVKVDVVTYTSMLHWLSNDGDVDGSLKLWEEMKEKGVGLTVVSYTAYMKVLFDNGRVKEATEVYKEMIRAGCAPSCVTYTVLMEHLAGCGKFNEVLDIFIKMQEAGVQPDKAACNILVENCCKAGETRVMMKILEYMKENSLVLRQPIYTKALEALKTAGESDALLKESNRHLSVHYKKLEPLVNDAVSDTLSTDKHLVLYLLTRKHFIGVDFLLKDMMEKNVFLTAEIVSSVIDTYTAHERPHGALLAYEYGKRMGIKFEKILYLSLVGLFIRTNSFPKIVDIVKEMVKRGIFLGVNQSALLIYKLGCANKPVSAAKVFDFLPDNEKNTTTYTALMAAYFASRRTCKGLEIFKKMKDAGIPVVVGTYNVLLAGLEKSGRVVEFEYYRKQKKQMQNVSFFDNQESVEEMSCNMLFGRDYAS
ncbi:putative tetratricopeptide-like helical domain superfamily [Helianthus annuus]|uniref:Putative tetratricopeptide repeat (TPR)-like superfamily protein n=1 Tax=Helianthus annuus TaxID=4232 RepID=A0A251SEB8_HELAN|nr:pentatricopeptide repeat-containing protein At2g01390 [Helianthus annuus]XP_035838583.1 pentatricopeptide repeat-containing protein At2g01390 [Helianthus annuus]XP_035838584.1 pentatricopeptide repeat-containing protein At2g01390 [Helianthus annuus]XP_035838585.1 pentatricopeptide repeat-containing protein At2g01390 [Helianthus annuus]XP_035838586.1 pentatricopeptide repeat-containing protein At2g01390 [Helianthus annuus]XP_035838587.1 pentatricopeptide repeat-containing protein At2g01390 [